MKLYPMKCQMERKSLQVWINGQIIADYAENAHMNPLSNCHILLFWNTLTNDLFCHLGMMTGWISGFILLAELLTFPKCWDIMQTNSRLICCLHLADILYKICNTQSHPLPTHDIIMWQKVGNNLFSISRLPTHSKTSEYCASVTESADFTISSKPN